MTKSDSLVVSKSYYNLKVAMNTSMAGLPCVTGDGSLMLLPVADLDDVVVLFISVDTVS